MPKLFDLLKFADNPAPHKRAFWMVTPKPEVARRAKGDAPSN